MMIHRAWFKDLEGQGHLQKGHYMDWKGTSTKQKGTLSKQKGTKAIQEILEKAQRPKKKGPQQI